MNELIKVSYSQERITVSARELHESLEIKTRFRSWFPRMKEYGFTENVDFQRASQKCDTLGGEQDVSDYEITLDMAKEIAMIQRTEKGKEVRTYFLELERKWNSPEAIMNRALEISRRQVKQLMEETEALKPKALFADAVATSEQSILIGQLAKIIKQNGYDIGQNRLFDWLRNNGYLCKCKDGRYNHPTQMAMDKELFEVKERVISNPDGSTRVTSTTKVTGKGQIYFINKFIKAEKEV